MTKFMARASVAVEAEVDVDLSLVYKWAEIQGEAAAQLREMIQTDKVHVSSVTFPLLDRLEEDGNG